MKNLKPLEKLSRLASKQNPRSYGMVVNRCPEYSEWTDGFILIRVYCCNDTVGVFNHLGLPSQVKYPSTESVYKLGVDGKKVDISKLLETTQLIKPAKPSKPVLINFKGELNKEGDKVVFNLTFLRTIVDVIGIPTSAKYADDQGNALLLSSEIGTALIVPAMITD